MAGIWLIYGEAPDEFVDELREFSLVSRGGVG